jgi:hypothetical protein
MNSFYNIIKISPNPGSGDTITLGLLVYSNNQYKVRFSKVKEKVIRSLIGKDNSIIKYIIKQIEMKIEELNKRIKENDNNLFDVPILSSNYFNYLSNYSNNILQFSKAHLIDDKITEEKFLKLFKILISPETETIPIKSEVNNDFKNRIQTKLISKVEGKVHTNIKLTEKSIPSLYFNFQLDCVGKNGVITSAKSIDFNLGDKTLDILISHYFQIMVLLTHKYNVQNKKNNFYLIGDEPDILKSKEHEIWEQIQKHKMFNIVHSEEANIVANKIAETNAHLFLDE